MLDNRGDLLQSRGLHTKQELKKLPYVQRRLATFPPPLLDLGQKHAKTVKKPIQLQFSRNCEVLWRFLGKWAWALLLSIIGASRGPWRVYRFVDNWCITN
jgi:hypothetical protein